MSSANLLGIMLEKVNKKLPQLFETDSNYFGLIKDRTKELKVSGRDTRIPIMLSGSGRANYFNSNGGDMGRGNSLMTQSALITTFDTLFAIELTQKSIQETDSSEKAIDNGYKKNIQLGLQQFQTFLDAQMVAANGTGFCGTVTAVASSGGVDTVTLGAGNGVKLIMVGQHIAVYNSALTVRRGDGFVTSVNIPNKTFTISSIAGLAATDILVAGNITSIPPAGIFGLNYFSNTAATGFLMGIDRATTPQIVPSGITASGSLTLPMVRLAINILGDRLGMEYLMKEKSKLKVIMHPAQVAAYEELIQLTMSTETSGKNSAVDMYFDNFTLAGVPVFKTYRQATNQIVFMCVDSFGRVISRSMGFHKDPNTGISVFPIAGASGGLSASWITYPTFSFNQFCDTPSGIVSINSLTVPTGY